MIDLVAENIDAGFRVGTLPDSALTARKLAQSERAVVASPAYLARSGVPGSPGDLLNHAGIVYEQKNSGGHEWPFRCGTSEITVRIQTRLTLTAAEGVREAVIAGYGFAVASRWIFAPELASGSGGPSQTMESASDGPLGDVSLGPTDEH